MEENLLRYRKGVKYIILDCESMNLCLNFQNNLPWQVAVLDILDEEIKQTLDLHINWPMFPNIKISSEASAVTRFNQREHDSKAILPDKAFNTFYPFIQKCDYLIMHNGLKFDIYLLKGYFEFIGIDWKWIMPKIIDTNAIARGIKMNIPYKPGENFLEYQYRMANIYCKGVKTNLTALGKEFNIDVNYENLHDGVNDCVLNLLVWNRLKWSLEY